MLPSEYSLYLAYGYVLYPSHPLITTILIAEEQIQSNIPERVVLVAYRNHTYTADIKKNHYLSLSHSHSSIEIVMTSLRRARNLCVRIISRKQSKTIVHT